MIDSPGDAVAESQEEPVARQIYRWFWLGLGWLAVGAGVVGIALPLVPTTPFLLLAAFCFSEGSPRLNRWLRAHPYLGPPITNWTRYGAISLRAKITAVGAMVLVLAFSLWMGIPRWALILQLLVLATVAAFLLSRPRPPDGKNDSLIRAP